MLFTDVGKVFRHLVPIDNVPPVAYIFRTSILVFQTETGLKKKQSATDDIFDLIQTSNLSETY
jgi:hypothetical protein